MFADISDSDDILSKLSSKQEILDLMNGCTLPYSLPWSTVDSVFIPIWLNEQKHWLLAILNFRERELIMCSTLSIHGADIVVRNALLPLSTLLPFLEMSGFYERTDIDFSAKCYTDKGINGCIRSIMESCYPRTAAM